MIQVAQSLPQGSRKSVDICIVGGGAAGISMALRLSGRNHSVLLVEAGGDGFDDRSQQLYRANSVGLHLDAETARLREFGGSTNHWGGRSRPLSAAEFARRDWVPSSGWPISHDAFMVFIPDALKICEIGVDGTQRWNDGVPEGGLWPQDGPFAPALWRFSPPTMFGDRYRDELATAGNVEVLLEAALVDMELDGGRISRLDLKTLDGRSFEVEARLVVLACGGIENARLLLAANRQERDGIGNRHGLVGRYFSGHPVYEPMQVRLGDSKRLPAFLNNWTNAKGEEFEGMLSLRPDRQKAFGTTAIDGAFYPGGQFGPPGIRALRRIYRAAKRGKMPQDLGGDIAAIAGDLGGIADELLERAGWRPQDGAAYSLSVIVEQVPDPDSRVTLLGERDALGLPVARIDWRLSELERHTVRTFARRLALEIGRLGLGRAQLEDWVADDSEPFPTHGNSSHHIGTTRMDPDPGFGVVDTDCRVHDVDNLYIAGSSVFPIGGAAHPTLNLVALALRLADHMAGRLDAMLAGGQRRSDDARPYPTSVP